MPKPRRSGLPLSLALLLSPWPMIFWMGAHQETFGILHHYTESPYQDLRAWVGWPLVAIICFSAINLFARRPTKREVGTWILWLAVDLLAHFLFVFCGLFSYAVF
jgi:hypothetical protein